MIAEAFSTKSTEKFDLTDEHIATLKRYNQSLVNYVNNKMHVFTELITDNNWKHKAYNAKLERDRCFMEISKVQHYLLYNV